MKLSVTTATSELGLMAERQKLVVFVGSGISVPSGLPTWDQMLLNFIEFCRDLQRHLPDPDRFDDLLADAEAQKDKYPARVASVLKRRLQEIQAEDVANVYGFFQDWFRDSLSGGQPNDYHKSLVSTAYPVILTTNYDNLLERAASDVGFTELRLNSFTFIEADKVAAALYEHRPSIIHVHGDMNRVALGDFIFTAEDYLQIKRNHPGFTMALQSIFLNYSVLFVGYGGSDPHLEDFMEEISYFLQWSSLKTLPKYYLTLLKGKAGAVLDKYKKLLRTNLVLLDSYEQTQELLDGIQSAAPRR